MSSVCMSAQSKKNANIIISQNIMGKEFHKYVDCMQEHCIKMSGDCEDNINIFLTL